MSDPLKCEVALSYEQTKEVIRALPSTWIPALIRLMVETAIEKGVFKSGQIHQFVKQFENTGVK